MIPDMNPTLPGMRRSVNRVFASLWRREAKLTYLLLLVITATVPLASKPVEASDQAAVQSMKDGIRPAGLYSLQFAADAKICKTILRSLNQPLKLPPDRVSPITQPNLPGDLLLTSNLDVPWQRKLVEFEGGVYQTLDFAEADLGNNGRPLAIYRLGFQMGPMSVMDLHILSQPIKQWSMERTLPNGLPALPLDVIKELGRQEISRDLLHEIAQIYDPKNDVASSAHMEFDVVKVNGSFVLLAIDANEANFAIDEGQSFDLFAYHYHSNAPPSVVCKLHGAF